jgi:NDP-mannose synthase
MAGGRGSRLAPYTTVLPKPLMPLSDRPILDVVLRQLAPLDIESVHISVGHMGSLIENWVRSQSSYGVPIHFVYEQEPLGTAGALGLMDDLGETFLAMNGDILTTLDYAALAEHHVRSGATATVAVKQRQVNVEYGVVHVDERGHVVRLEEKPRLEYTVSMGVYAFAAGVLRHIETGKRADFPDVLERAAAAGDTVAAFPFDGYWRDIGNHDDYEAAISEFEADPGRFLPR